jgi:prolyl 4-hydroxylase
MHEMLDRCRNEDANCAFWALVGECNNSPGFMKVSCAPVCHSCELLSRATRCPADPGHMEQQVWKPGSVNEFFRNLTTLSEYQKYGPELISKPGPNDDMPWLVTLNKFLTDKECDKLLTIANMEGLSPSQDSMGKTPDYAQTWLVNDIIKGDRIVEKILRKIEKLTKIPEVNAENIQVVKVEQGHPQSLHHDYIHQQADRLPGVRILTIFLFLNDIEDGGEMDFPRLGIQVLPKKGRAIVWPTVRDDDPNKREERVFHRAAEVRKGVRYTANVLHHQRDFKGPQLANCH